MATIRTAIALYDGVTAPLQAMHKAMNIVLNSFEAMQRASGNSVDTSAIREARDELARAGAAFDEIEENIRQAGNQQDRFNRRIRDGTTAADGLWGKLKGIAATVGGLAATKKILNISDQFSNTNARLNNAMINFDDGGSLDMTVSHQTVVISHGHPVVDTYTGGGEATPIDHNHPIQGRKKFKVHNALVVGDWVLLARMQKGKKFVVLDRIKANPALKGEWL